MHRRSVLSLLGTSAAASAWPMTARAQQQAMPVIGWLHATSAEVEQPFIAAFRKGLSETGFVEGRNLAIDYRYADNDYNRLPALVTELARRRVAVILALGGALVTRAAKAITADTPIVFVQGDDPVTAGLVTSLNRPGANVTGVVFLSTELGPKRLGLLKELVPTAKRYALLVNPNNPTTDTIIVDMKAAAASIERHLDVFPAGSVREIDSAFAELVQREAEALVVGGSSLFATRRVHLATLAAIHRLPAVYYTRGTAEVGGLMSYGADISDAMHQAGVYVGRILKGERPANLPVVQSTKFELILNLQTARSLGITVPPTLLAIADAVIE